MLGHLYEQQDCSAARALELVGERWSLLILRDAMFAGSTRFGEFQKGLEIAPNILSKRLKDFVEAGIMESTAGGQYHLTRKGMELKTVIVALTLWGDKWVRPGPIVYIADDCGGTVEAQLRCDAGGAELDVEDVTVRLR